MAIEPVLVVGSVGLDKIHVPDGTFDSVVGGSATFASVAAGQFAPVRLVGIVGQDFPDSAVHTLLQRGVDLTGLEVAAGKTFHWEGRYSDDLSSRESLVTDLNTFADFHPRIPDRFTETPYVMLGNIAPELQLEVLDQVRSPKLVVADTMNFWIDIALADLKRVLARTDILVLNEEEARMLSGQHNVVKAAKDLQAMGPQRVVVKQGEYGALLFDGDDVFSAPALPLGDVKDPTGAGDSFAGGLIGFLASRDRIDPEALRQAVVFGSVMASYCVEAVGPEHLAQVNEAMVSERYGAFRSLVDFHRD